MNLNLLNINDYVLKLLLQNIQEKWQIRLSNGKVESFLVKLLQKGNLNSKKMEMPEKKSLNKFLYIALGKGYGTMYRKIKY